MGKTIEPMSDDLRHLKYLLVHFLKNLLPGLYPYRQRIFFGGEGAGKSVIVSAVRIVGIVEINGKFA
jgi:hypothetical protein